MHHFHAAGLGCSPPYAVLLKAEVGSSETRPVQRLHQWSRSYLQMELSPDLKTLTITMQPSGQSNPNIVVFDRE